MHKCTLYSIIIVFLLTLPACDPVKTVEPTPTRRVLSPEEDYAAEELVAEIIATASAKKTQSASITLPYIEISNEEKNYLAFWFRWNGETVFLPLADSTMADSSLLTCQLHPETKIAIGELISGWKIVQDECLVDETTPQNASPIVRIPGYFDDGIKFDENDDAETRIWNIIDLNGEYAGNFADIVTFVIENDLLGSSDLTLNLYRTDEPHGEPSDSVHVIPSYYLPAEALQIRFSNDQLGNFEYVDDVIYALKREFTWEILAGFSDLDLSPGDENWFVLKINESEGMSGSTYIQIIEVGTSNSH